MEETMPKTKTKVKPNVSMVFGSYFSRYVEDVITAYHNAIEEGIDPIQASLKYLKEECSDGESLTIDTKEFDTEAEVNAYLQGVMDAEGWMDYYQLDQEQAEILKKIIAERDKK